MVVSGAAEGAARAALGQCDFHGKVASGALSKKTSIDQARGLLEASRGSVRQALAT